MFKQLSTFALLATYAAALTLETPSGWTSAGAVTVSWTADSTDPMFSLELVNPNNFHNSFAIANNVNPSLGSLNLTLPIVPAGSGYQLEAVNVTNINDIYASTPEFSIGEMISTTSTTPSSTVSSTSSGASSGAATATVSSSSTPFGTTVSGSRTASGSSGSQTSGTSSSAPSPSTFNGNGNGAASFASLNSWGVMALAAVAGAAITL